jgi:hypothetical protein
LQSRREAVSRRHAIEAGLILGNGHCPVQSATGTVPGERLPPREGGPPVSYGEAPCLGRHCTPKHTRVVYGEILLTDGRQRCNGPAPIRDGGVAFINIMHPNQLELRLGMSEPLG